MPKNDWSHLTGWSCSSITISSKGLCSYILWRISNRHTMMILYRRLLLLWFEVIMPLFLWFFSYFLFFNFFFFFFFTIIPGVDKIILGVFIIILKLLHWLWWAYTDGLWWFWVYRVWFNHFNLVILSHFIEICGHIYTSI